MKTIQAASVLEEIASVIESGGGKTGAADLKALAAYLRESAANDVSEVLPAHDQSRSLSIYLEALRAAGANRKLFDSIVNILKKDKSIDPQLMATLATQYSTIPKLNGRTKALKAIQDRFETIVQRERKLRDIDRLTDG